MDDYAKEIEDALDKTLNDDLMPKLATDKINGGPTRPSQVRLAAQIDQVIAGLHSRIRALEAFKDTL